MLGVLLEHGTFASDFLVDVGGDMVDFEREHGEDVWIRSTSTAPYGRHLDLVDGSAGFDPMVGLMKGLAGNPEASKTFFAVQATEPNSRLDYLLTDRTWQVDLPPGEPVPEDYYSPGIDYLGQALDGATTGSPRDQTSATIMQGVVQHLALDAETRDGVMEQTDIVPPPIRDSLGHMFSTYVGDVNATFNPSLDRSGDWDDPALPGPEPGHAVFDEMQLLRVLADTAKDDGAYREMYDTQTVYTALALDAAAIDGNPLGPDTIGRDALVEDRREAIAATANRSAGVFGALDFGHNLAVEEAAEQADKANNDEVTRNSRLVSFGINEAAKRVPIPGAGQVADGYLKALVESWKDDSTGKTNVEIGLTYGNSEEVVSSLVHDAIYDNNIYETTQAPPPELRGPDGQLIPEPLLTDEQRKIYNDWVLSAGGNATFAPVEDARSSYGQGYQAAQTKLQDEDRD